MTAFVLHLDLHQVLFVPFKSEVSISQAPEIRTHWPSKTILWRLVFLAQDPWAEKPVMHSELPFVWENF